MSLLEEKRSGADFRIHFFDEENRLCVWVIRRFLYIFLYCVPLVLRALNKLPINQLLTDCKIVFRYKEFNDLFLYSSYDK